MPECVIPQRLSLVGEERQVFSAFLWVHTRLRKETTFRCKNSIQRPNTNRKEFKQFTFNCNKAVTMEQKSYRKQTARADFLSSAFQHKLKSAMSFGLSVCKQAAGKNSNGCPWKVHKYVLSSQLVHLFTFKVRIHSIITLLLLEENLNNIGMFGK